MSLLKPNKCQYDVFVSYAGDDNRHVGHYTYRAAKRCSETSWQRRREQRATRVTPRSFLMKAHFLLVVISTMNADRSV